MGHYENSSVLPGSRSGSALSRIRYHNIQADRFSWVLDRSVDGGKTWVPDHQTIEARRIGPARTLGALAPARNRPGSSQ